MRQVLTLAMRAQAAVCGGSHAGNTLRRAAAPATVIKVRILRVYTHRQHSRIYVFWAT